MHETEPIVSVIMGVYNIGSLTVFRQSVESILTQTFRKFELILCADGSTADTWRRLESLASQDNRIKLLQNCRNEGLAAALNYCVDIAQGRFIARHDADDFSLSDRFSRQVDFLEEHPKFGFVGSSTDVFDSSGVWRRRRFPAHPEPEDFLFTLPFIHGSLMFRKEILEANPYKVTKATRRAEDYELLMRLYARGIQGANLQEPLYLFQEDRSRQRHQKFVHRINEMKVKWTGFQALGLMPKALPYIVKPLLVGLIPADVLRKLKQKRSF